MAANNSGDKGLRAIVIGMIVFVLAITGIFIYLDKKPTQNALTPASISKADGSGLVFNPGVKPQIDIWEDFQCPACRDFEAINNEYVKKIIAEKKAKVVYHPLTFIGERSSLGFNESIIAANAAACAMDENKFVDMHEILYQNQAATENSGKWTKEFMISLGNKIGLTSMKFQNCVTGGNYALWTESVSSYAAVKNVNSTPTIFVNGKELSREGG
ncbi:MAG: thioredoxin domain-containing protein, partial [Actinobacteria bacterium]|nr:thioredoxin domain-containing protein [Actinomycetota bacterium]